MTNHQAEEMLRMLRAIQQELINILVAVRNAAKENHQVN